MTKKRRRFYEAVTLREEEQGVCVALDGRCVKSAGGRKLVLPNRPLAQALADEWQQQEEFVEFAQMPMMQFLSKVCDNSLPQPEEVRAEIVKYARSDLLCYRAPEPERLVKRQAENWGPVLKRLHKEEGIGFKVTSGIGWVEQEEGQIAKFATLLHPFTGYRLGALHEITLLSGSAILAFALARKWLSADQLWTLCHLDEDFQVEQWGADEEAQALRAQKYKAFQAAERGLALIITV